MKQKKNECAFCGRPTNYYSYDLLCYVCPKCLGEYKTASGNVIIYPYRYSYMLPEPFLSRQVWRTSSTLTTSELSPKKKNKK